MSSFMRLWSGPWVVWLQLQRYAICSVYICIYKMYKLCVYIYTYVCGLCGWDLFLEV